MRTFGRLLLCWSWALGATAIAADYDIGPGQPYTNIGDFDWGSLEAGDTVRIHARATPYREKWVIGAEGTAAQPIVVRGVPDTSGNLPIIDGQDATTPSFVNFWNEERALIKVGGSNSPGIFPKHIVIESLHLRHARSANAYTGDDGNAHQYIDNAAGIFIEEGEHITVRGCEIEDNGNGLFVAEGASDVLVERNDFHDNGNVLSAFEHNVYSGAHNITFQFNRFRALCANCSGNNLKDRSSGTVIRYNWIEGGNRQLDLVDSAAVGPAQDPAYAVTYVYGNVLFESSDDGNSQIVHFGGDQVANEANYRPTLYLWNNTIVSQRSGNTTLLRLSSSGQTAHVLNNIVFVTAGSGRLALLADNGTLNLSANWLSAGYVPTHGTLTGTIDDAGNNTVGATPGFVDASNAGFRLTVSAEARGQAASLPAALSGHPLARQYVVHRQDEARPEDAALDQGAFEFGTTMGTDGGSGGADGGGGGGGGGIPGGGPSSPPGSPQGCSCRQGGTLWPGVSGLWLLLLGAATRRKRGTD